jgi:thiosulfate/3-mercaptopyruvate sulfurtransferase
VTAEVPEVKPGSINPKPRPEIIVKTAWLADHLRDPGLLLIDARNTEFYEGKEKGSGARAGHIPGAVSIPFNTVVDDSNKIKDRAELQKLFPPGATPQTASPVTYCHVGQQASLLYVVAKFLGYSPRLYDESFQVWSRQPDLPVDAPAAKKVS